MIYPLLRVFNTLNPVSVYCDGFQVQGSFENCDTEEDVLGLMMGALCEGSLGVSVYTFGEFMVLKRGIIFEECPIWCSLATRPSSPEHCWTLASIKFREGARNSLGNCIFDNSEVICFNHGRSLLNHELSSSPRSSYDDGSCFPHGFHNRVREGGHGPCIGQDGVLDSTPGDSDQGS